MPEDSNDDERDTNPVDTSTRLLVDEILFVLGMTMFVVGLVAEILGWWGALGVILSLGGLLVGLFSAMDRNGVAQLEGQSTTHAVLMRMASNQAKTLGNQEEMLGNHERMLGNQEEMIEHLERIADTLAERLPES